MNHLLELHKEMFTVLVIKKSNIKRFNFIHLNYVVFTHNEIILYLKINEVWFKVTMTMFFLVCFEFKTSGNYLIYRLVIYFLSNKTNKEYLRNNYCGANASPAKEVEHTMI